VAHVISGALDTMADRVWLMIPKELVDDPVANDVLSEFYVFSSHGNRTMDFAPDAQTLDPDGLGGLDPLDLLPDGDADAQNLVVPNYGRDYVFAWTPQPTGGSGGGSPGTPALQVTVDSTSKVVKAGQSIGYTVTVRNAGNGADDVVMALNSAATGWSHEFVGVNGPLSLAAGASRDVTLLVSASDKTTGSFRSVVDATSAAGAAQSVSVLTIAETPGPPSGGPSPSDPGADGGEDEDAGGGSPGLSMIAVVSAAAAALAVTVLRRRRQ
jgi:hypothetical protein